MYRNALIAYRVAAAPFLAPGPGPFAEDYGPDAALFCTILDQAVRDRLSARLDRPHEEVLRLAESRVGISLVPQSQGCSA